MCGAEEEVWEPVFRVEEMQGDGQGDCEQRNIQNLAPPCFCAGTLLCASQQHESGGPESELDPYVVDKKDCGGLRVEELLYKRKGDVAVVVQTRGESESAAERGGCDPEEWCKPPTYGVAEHHRGEACYGSEKQVAKVFKCAVTQNRVEDETWVEEVDDHPHERGIGFLA